MAELKSNGDFNCHTLNKFKARNLRIEAFSSYSHMRTISDWEKVHMEEIWGKDYSAGDIANYFLTATNNIATWKLEPQLFMDHLDFKVVE